MRAAGRWLAPAFEVLRSGREPTSPERRRLVLVAALSLVAAGWLVAGPLAGLALGAAAPWIARAVVRARAARRRDAIAAQAPAIARALADALAGGHSVRGALAAAARGGGVPGAAGEELRIADAALELGERTDDVLRELARRAGGGPCDTLVAAVLLQRDAGGDLAGLLRSLAMALESRARVVAEARSATAQARFTALARHRAADRRPRARRARAARVRVRARRRAGPWRPRRRGRRAAGHRAAVRAQDRAGRGGAMRIDRRARPPAGSHDRRRDSCAHPRVRGGPMTRAVALAALSGILAATAIVEFAAAPRSARRRPRTRARAAQPATSAARRRAPRRDDRAARPHRPARGRAQGTGKPGGPHRRGRRAARPRRRPTSWRSRAPTRSSALLVAFSLMTALPGQARHRRAAVRARRRLPRAGPHARPPRSRPRARA